MAILECCLTGPPGHEHHDLTSHSVTLSWHWASKSLPYPNNTERQARKWQVSISMSLVWLNQGSNPRGSDSPVLPKWETDTLLIRPPCLAQNNWTVTNHKLLRRRATWSGKYLYLKSYGHLYDFRLNQTLAIFCCEAIHIEYLNMPISSTNLH